MGLFNRKKVKNEVETTVVQTDEVLLKALINGEPIDRDMAMSIPAVADDVDFICNTIAMIPIKLYQETTDSETKTKKG